MDLSEVLFIAVTCTRDKGRARALQRLVRSMNGEHRRCGLLRHLLVFDNGSRILAPLDGLQMPGRLVRCEANVGYWSALRWCLNNAQRLYSRSFRYVHPIESDLVVYRLERLIEATAFLDAEEGVESVRTQEFSVARKHFYFKNSRAWLCSRRSRVADYHGVTGEKVSFKAVSGHPSLFLANWHAKVPALHRFQALREVFEKLAQSPEVTEHDFMTRMHERAAQVGVLDGGIYYTQSYAPSARFLSGSYSHAEELSQVGYRTTRKDWFQPVPQVEVSWL